MTVREVREAVCKSSMEMHTERLILLLFYYLCNEYAPSAK